MKEQNHDINDLFAAARNAEVKISLDDVRANLSKNTAKLSLTNWRRFIVLITGVLLLTFALFFIPTKDTTPELTMATHTTTMEKTTKTVDETIKVNNTQNTSFSSKKQEKKTSPKTHETYGASAKNKKEKNEVQRAFIQPIVFDGLLKNTEFKAMSKLKLLVSIQQQKTPKTLPAVDTPDFKMNRLQGDLLEGGKGEIHYMETLKNKETISLKSYKKRGKKYLKLDHYNADFEIIRSIDLSHILQKNKRNLHAVKQFNNQLLLITSEGAAKEKAKLYIGHQIDYNTMEKKSGATLGKFSLSSDKKGINIQTSMNGKYLLINPKPGTIKSQKKQFEKGQNETISFQVYDENMKPFYTVKKDGMLDYGTAIDNSGKIYIWKTQPEFLPTNRLIPTLKNGNILYQFGANSIDSLILKENSFLNTISLSNSNNKNETKRPIRSKTSSYIAYNHRLIETRGLTLTISPEGNPILYGYLKNMRGLQQLTFTTDSLAPHHYSVLDFQTKAELEAETARKNGVPELVLKVDEVFFDEASNFYVLSSSYNRSYLPLVEQERNFKHNDFSKKTPIPYYPSLDIYVHKFSKTGSPIMSTQIASNAINQNEKTNNYSYLFNKNNFSVVYLDHVDTLGNKRTNRKELMLATTKQNGEVIRLTASGDYTIDMEDYRPVKYFRNKGETLALLKAGKSYKISKLSYKTMPKRFKEH
ncbi:hypothetical protein [Aureispira anguillae]|uniref:Uncharacterized protein n=1 Tax=Aureispira anguillae TaxID=2864201 RepID=A0A915YLX7_9BACT|nr:hypothetical protein [Aureispira anguillae]BDS15647.1 hypothetical protein AsAng_0064310 [Aureispira anguillae]